MRFGIIVMLFAAFNLLSFAQKVERIIIKGGPEYFEALKREIYLYPTFSNGIAFFKNGTVLPAKMNYHKGFDEIQIINNSDTVAFVNLYEIKHVIINSDTFVYDGRFIMLVHNAGSLVLGKHGKVRAANKEDRVAYGRMPDPGSSGRPYTALGFRANGDGTKDFPLIKQTVFYIGNRHRQFTKVTRKNILYMFPGKEHLVNHYLAQQAIDLNDEKHLEQLLGYLETLR